MFHVYCYWLCIFYHLQFDFGSQPKQIYHQKLPKIGLDLMPNHNGYRNRGGDFICVPQKWVTYVTEVDPDINIKIKSYKFPFLWIVLWRVFVMKIQDSLFITDVHCFFFFFFVIHVTVLYEPSFNSNETKVSYIFGLLNQSISYMICFPSIISLFCRIYFPTNITYVTSSFTLPNRFRDNPEGF